MKLLLALALASTPVQDDPARDWDLHRDPESGSLMAVTTWDTGFGLAFRCRQGSFAAVAAGLPPERGQRRRLMIRFRDERPYASMWTPTTDRSVAVADYPAMLAREFRQGGSLRITVPDGAADGRDLTYAVELPASNTAIDTVLTECGKPLVDPRDAELEAVEGGGLSGGATWARAPRVRFPNTNYASGFAVVTCLARPEGRLTDCLLESEHPQDGRFGEAALRGARAARVAFPDGPPPGPIRVGFYVGFRQPR